MMFVEASILDQFDPCAQQWRDIGGRQDETVLAVNGEHAADDGWIEAEYGQFAAIGHFQTRDRRCIRPDRHRLGLAQFVQEACAPGMQVEGPSVAAVDARTRRRVPPPIVEAMQFLFEIIRGHRGADV